MADFFSKRLLAVLVGLMALCLATCQQLRVQSSSHWCEQPTEQLRWLSQLVGNVRSYAAQGGWEMHQAQYDRQEVFVLYLIIPRNARSSFVLYNHHGDELHREAVAESLILPKLQHDRLLAGAEGIYWRKR